MNLRIVFGALVAAALVVGCSSSSNSSTTPGRAVAKIKPASGQFVIGEAWFFQRGTNVKVVLDLEKLDPGSTHAVHIHEKGDLSAADLSTAGAHFNPGNKPHGGPDDVHHHAGDFGNVKADSMGRAHLELTTADISLDPASTNSIIGRSVIVHGGKDDLKSQPSGDSGPRIGGGVIEIAK